MGIFQVFAWNIRMSRVPILVSRVPKWTKKKNATILKINEKSWLRGVAIRKDLLETLRVIVEPRTR
jgi:hypothetical protein